MILFKSESPERQMLAATRVQGIWPPDCLLASVAHSRLGLHGWVRREELLDGSVFSVFRAKRCGRWPQPSPMATFSKHLLVCPSLCDVQVLQFFGQKTPAKHDLEALHAVRFPGIISLLACNNQVLQSFPSSKT